MSVCTIPRLTGSHRVDGVWDKHPWNRIGPLTIGRHMGSEPGHKPDTRVKIACDGAVLYLIFRVADRYVRAVTPADQGPVCRDSCVEFFFVPGPDPGQGYFNIEMNCGGTMLFHFQQKPRGEYVDIAPEDRASMTRAHSLPAVVEPEIADPVTWTVEYSLPLSVLGRHTDVTPPVSGAVWRGNFYKCADRTSHPHWLTWAPVDNPTPDFHRPDCFGRLLFE